MTHNKEIHCLTYLLFMFYFLSIFIVYIVNIWTRFVFIIRVIN